MRFVITCLMSLLLVPTFVASTPPNSPPNSPQRLHSLLGPYIPVSPLPHPAVGRVVGYVHEKSHGSGIVTGFDHGGHYNVAPIIHRNGAPDILHEVVVKAHPYDVHHTNTVHPELATLLAHNPRPPFVVHPTAPHPNSVHNVLKTYTGAAATANLNGGHGGTGGH